MCAKRRTGACPSPDRRIWFVLDELADLPRVDNVARLLPEGRKFGAAVVLTFQALGQMRHRYGPQIAGSMLGCCNTKLFLQTIDSENPCMGQPDHRDARSRSSASSRGRLGSARSSWRITASPRVRALDDDAPEDVALLGDADRAQGPSD